MSAATIKPFVESKLAGDCRPLAIMKVKQRSNAQRRLKMKTPHRPVAVGLLILLLSLSTGVREIAIAQSKSVQAAPTDAALKTRVKKKELAARLESVIPQLMKEGDVPGLSVLLIRDGKVFWQRAFGVKNAETKEPVNDTTVFEAASLSKPVFAYAVLRLADSGKLDLDTPLVKYLPGAYVEDDERLNQITARMVLSHRTGFPNWRPRGGALKIHFTPGEKFSYSGEGFVYLQKVLEHMTGLSLDALMKRTVFEPLGMTSSSYVWQERYQSLKAFGHNQAGGVTERRQPTEANAAASLHTTSADYARFVIAVMNGTGLKRETARLMLTPQIKVQEGCQNCVNNPGTGRLLPDTSWGLGWGLQQTLDGDSFWHWGDSNNDVQCYVVAYPKQKLGIIIFTDSGNGHSIIPRIINEAIGGRQPALAWLSYESYDSPARQLLKDILARGEAAITNYRERSRDAADALDERQINRLGYQLLQRQKVKEAIAVFKWNVERFPESFNVYDSLGEAYMISGDKELAIKNYQKSVELNPQNENGIEILKKLQGK
ncbi:MAG TPA: serine hydrolase [Pyrinomonadaceae bacterium]